MKVNEKILTITYFYGTNGCCMAEWADDKVDSICKLDKRTILITSIFSKKNSNQNVRHYRVPSLSIEDLKHELHELKVNKMPVPYISLLFFTPLIISIGLTIDILQKILISGNGGGKWSWAISASICGLYLAIRHQCNVVFTTGGPASAHLAGVFINLLTKKRLVCELQDPLTGKDIGRNFRSAFFLGYIEKIILNNANKIVYVTKDAAEHVKNKYSSIEDKVLAIYPGSKYFNVLNNFKTEDKNVKLSIIHLGTLYSTRNFYTLINAIDSLIYENKISQEQIEILNLGEIYGELKEHHLSKPYIRYEAIKPRETAIKVASSYKVLLLVQHTDDRSNTTIPYKTYDYLNISNPILALTNNDELSSMLISNGHLAIDVHDIEKIKTSILDLYYNYENIKNRIQPLSIDILKQVKNLLE